MSKPFKNETDLAARVIAWLDGFEVYQEVGFQGRVADIVVDVAGRGWVIETKLSLGLSVLEQADHWLRRGVCRVSVAVPVASNSERLFAYRVAKRLGVGIIVVDRSAVDEKLRPVFQRCKHADILSVCDAEHHRTAAAGTAGGGYWTPFKQTCTELLRVVTEEPGICLSHAINRTKHHYRTTSTATSCLSKWIDAGKVTGVESRREGKKVLLFPTGREA